MAISSTRNFNLLVGWGLPHQFSGQPMPDRPDNIVPITPGASTAHLSLRAKRGNLFSREADRLNAAQPQHAAMGGTRPSQRVRKR